MKPKQGELVEERGFMQKWGYMFVGVVQTTGDDQQESEGQFRFWEYSNSLEA
jgi:hypothetical protein